MAHNWREKKKCIWMVSGGSRSNPQTHTDLKSAQKGEIQGKFLFLEEQRYLNNQVN